MPGSKPASRPNIGRRRPPAAATAAGNGVDKRERILAAAEDLFYSNGLAGTTMDMLCAELGVTKPFVYYYFKDKHEIVETLAWRASVACLTTMKFAADDRRPAHEKPLSRQRAGLSRHCVAAPRGPRCPARTGARLLR
jgi:AcrR family transcriptional regulator